MLYLDHYPTMGGASVDLVGWVRGMDLNELETSADPIALFRVWLKDAEAGELNDPNAVALATVTAGGAPSVRMVLLKGLDERGFAFYTNAQSRKGIELAENPRAAMCF